MGRVVKIKVLWVKKGDQGGKPFLEKVPRVEAHRGKNEREDIEKDQ